MSLGRHLKEFARQHGPDKAGQMFREARKERKITEAQVSLRDLAEGLLGPAWEPKLRRCRNQPFALREATLDAIDVSAFSNITGQLLVDKVKEQYASPDFIGGELVETLPVTNGNLGTHKVPYLSNIVEDPPDAVQPLEHYPFSTFQEQYITLPATRKRGSIVAISFEMIFSDLTKQAMDSAGLLGRRVGLAREKDILNVVLGLTNNFIYNGTSYNTYLTSGLYTNAQSSLVVEDWEDINTLEQLFTNMTDPVTSEVIHVPQSERKVLCMPQKRYTAKRILNATNTRSGVYPTSGTAGFVTESPNPLDAQYPILSSPIAYQLLTDSGVSAANAKEYFFIGAFKRAFVYREVYPLTTIEAPPQNAWQFGQDVAFAVKASEFGVAGVMDPRFAVKGYNA